MATYTSRVGKDGKTRWKAEISVNGHRASKWHESKKAARDWAVATEAAMRAGRITARGARHITLREALDMYRRAEIVQFFDAQGNELSESIKGCRMVPKRRTLRTSLAEYVRLEATRRDPLCDKTLARLTRADVREWRSRRLASVAATTVRRDLAMLSSAIEYIRDEYEGAGIALAENVFKAARRRKRFNNPDSTAAHSRERVFTEDEIAALRGALSAHKRGHELVLMFEIARETGLRMSELVALEHRDVSTWTLRVERVDDVGGKSVEGTKNKKKAEIPLTPHARVMLDELGRGAPNQRLFSFTYEALKSAKRRAYKASGVVDGCWHDLRHHALTTVDEALCGDLIATQTVGRHSTPTMTRSYVHRNVEAIAKRLELAKAA